MAGEPGVKLAEDNGKSKDIYEGGEQCRMRFDPDEVHVL